MSAMPVLEVGDKVTRFDWGNGTVGRYTETKIKKVTETTYTTEDGATWLRHNGNLRGNKFACTGLWSIDGVNGKVNVLEWWHIPKPGTGEYMNFKRVR